MTTAMTDGYIDAHQIKKGDTIVINDQHLIVAEAIWEKDGTVILEFERSSSSPPAATTLDAER